MISLHKITKLWLILLIGTLSGCSTFFLNQQSSFIRVNETKFFLNDEPYYFLGTNYWYGCYLGSSGITGDRERMIQELDLLESLGVKNLRILAASEKSDIKNSLRPAIQKQPGVYDEDLLEGLDFLLYEMSQREMHAVLFLNNYWEWSGGMSQYNAWSSGEKAADPEDPNYGWGEFMRLSATFYSNQKANENFKKYIEKIITRKNKFSGLFYFEDPTIMSWQLANEPRPWGSGDQIIDYYKWVDSTAAFIRILDPNHLISTGNEGTMGSLESEEYYITAHKSKLIDYLTFHLWVKNWGWYDANRADETYPLAEKKAINYINKHIEFANLIGKPIVLEEFGIARDKEEYNLNSSTTIRNKYYETIYQLICDSASSGAPISGSNFWTWGGLGRAKHDDYKWREGDSFAGDPPQEPQGLNSVFDSDASTLQIIKKFAKQMVELRSIKSDKMTSD